MKEIKNKQLHEYNLNCVKAFKKSFFDLNNREPLESEIIDNLKDTMPLDVLKKIINELSAEEDNIQDLPFGKEKIRNDSSTKSDEYIEKNNLKLFLNRIDDVVIFNSLQKHR